MIMTEETLKEALSTEQEGAWLQELEQEEEYQTSKMLEWLAPWLEKTDEESTLGLWQDTLPTTMMVKLLEMWLTDESRKRLWKMLQFYHPVDRAAMAYALLLYMMTGRKTAFKSAMAQQNYNVMCDVLLKDMPELTFMAHLKEMIDKYGSKDENS